jgi:hypothetical protein
MEHPIMFRDDDFGLAEVRRICLALPEATEKIGHGRPHFRTTTGFAVYGGGTRGADRIRYDNSVLVKPFAGHRDTLLRDPRFFDPAYVGPSGWVGLDLLAAEVDWDEVSDLVEESYRETAPARLVRELEDRAVS